MKTKSERQKFTQLVDTLLSVPHSEIKTKLDAEKAAKKRKKSRSSSAKSQVHPVSCAVNMEQPCPS